MMELAQRSLQLRYPQHRQSFNPQRCQFLLENQMRFATGGYIPSLRDLAQDLASEECTVPVFQLPFSAKDIVALSAEDIAKRDQRQKEQIQLLRSVAKEKRTAKLARARQRYTGLSSLYQWLAEVAPVDRPAEETKARFTLAGVRDAMEVDDALRDSRTEVWKCLQMAKNRDELDTEELVAIYDKVADEVKKEKEAAESYPLLDIPDAELTADQLVEKRRQRLMRGAAEARKRTKERKEREAAEKEKQRRLQEQLRLSDPDRWLSQLKSRRKELVNKLESSKKSAMGVQRRSVAAEERMKAIIATLAEAPVAKGKRKTPEGEDEFGDDDEDWQVYRHLQQLPDDDDETPELEAELAEVDAAITSAEPHHVAYGAKAETGPRPLVAEDYQIDLAADTLRVPELLFQPSIIGIDQAGLAEVLGLVLANFPPDVQQRLADVGPPSTIAGHDIDVTLI